MNRFARGEPLRSIRSLDAGNLLAAGLATELLFITMNTSGLGSAYGIVRVLVLGISVGAIALALVSAPVRPRRAVDKLPALAIVYFAWTATQHAIYSEALNTVLSLLSVVVVIVAARTSLNSFVSGLRRWVLVIVITLLLPALVGQGFDANKRVWLGLVPGRYFGFSNPDALGFVAGLAIVLSIPVLSRWRGRALFALGVVLFAITASYTVAIAAGLAVVANLLLPGVRGSRILRSSIPALSAVTTAGLVWISTDHGIAALETLNRHVSLSGRTLIWVQLMKLARGRNYFWTGLGDTGVSVYTLKILKVASAHMTLLQMLLSAGFLTAVFFILVCAIVATRTLSRITVEPDRAQRLAFAVVVYWFVTSLVSTEPSAAVCVSLIVALAVSSSGDDSLVETLGRAEPERDRLGWRHVVRMRGRRGVVEP